MSRPFESDPMPAVPGLRSPYDKVGRLVHFGRMLDKIRLHAAGRLPPEYQANYGDSQTTVFDTRCCRFLGVSHAELERRTLEGGSDEEILAWAEARGGRRSDDDCAMFNVFLMKRGWRDGPGPAERLRLRIAESGLQSEGIQTFFDYIDFDEGRDPHAGRPWEKV